MKKKKTFQVLSKRGNKGNKEINEHILQGEKENGLSTLESRSNKKGKRGKCSPKRTGFIIFISNDGALTQ